MDKNKCPKLKSRKKSWKKNCCNFFDFFVTEKKIKVTKILKFILFYDCNFFYSKIINLKYF
jgi:hypothetical protein